MTTYRIHPAIGIARVGDSPDGFFTAPERLGTPPEPPGGYKDAAGRVKRQAVRFRVYAYGDDGSVQEVTAATARITWTVHVANAKAAQASRGNPEPRADLTIDPGPRTAGTPGAREVFDGGTIRFQRTQRVAVPLGEMRVDDDGTLLVLGGAGAAGSPTGRAIGDAWGNRQWWDDIADGPVTAVVTLPDGTSRPAEAAWVIVAPPKFAPHQDSVVTLWDRLRQHMTDIHLLPADEPTSYAADVEPVLRRARDIGWVRQVNGSHGWDLPVTDPATVDRIVGTLTLPQQPGGMPRLKDTTITAIQYRHMLNWQAGKLSAGQPLTAPEELDRAALDAAAGAPLQPGVEAGGRHEPDSYDQPILRVRYVAPFRVDPATPPGTLTRAMALPWQADYWACTDEWWPVPRPGRVVPAGSADGARERWERGVDTMDEMVELWSSLGFVVTRGDSLLEVGRNDLPAVTVAPNAVLADGGYAIDVAVVAGAGPHTYTVAGTAASVTVDGIGSGRLLLPATPGPVTVTVVEQGSARSWPVLLSPPAHGAEGRPSPADGDDRQVILDTDGVVVPDFLQRIKFPVCAADTEVELVLRAADVDLRLKSPNGALLDPGRSPAAPGTSCTLSGGTATVTLTPPTRVAPPRADHYGMWQVLLTAAGHADPLALPQRMPDAPDGGRPYALQIRARSTLTLAVAVVPGDPVRVEATVSENGRPLDAVVAATVTGPGGAVQAGTTFTADTPGDYVIRVEANGRTSRNQAYSRTARVTYTRAL